MRLDIAVDAEDMELLVALDPKDWTAVALELQRRCVHPHEVAALDALEAPAVGES